MKVLSRRMRSTLLLASLALFTVACRDSGPNGGPGGRDAGPKGDGSSSGLECPGEGQTVCALKLASSSRHPQVMEPVQLSGVVVTTGTVAVSKNMAGMTTLAGFYVQDPTGADFLEGRYSGIAIVYNPAEITGRVPPIGTKLNVTGAYAEFGQMNVDQQKQVRAASIESLNELATITPITIPSANLIARGGADAVAYEGVIVRVEGVSVASTEVMVGTSVLFGAFRLEGDLVVSGQYYEYRGTVVGEVFSSITGVLRVGTAPFDAGEYLITPRAEAEVVPQNPRVVINSIGNINNASAPGYVRDICTNDASSGFTCPKIELRHVLVAAVDGYVSANLRAMWVLDTTDADGLYAGAKVVYNPMRTANIPEVGQFVDIDGELLAFFGTRQIQFPTITRNGTDTQVPVAKVIDPARIGQMAASAIEHMSTLVKVENVTVTSRCLEGTNGDDFGGWLVTGSVQIGTAFAYDYHGRSRPMGTVCQDQMRMPTGACRCDGNMVVPRPGDMRRDGDMFLSITGIVDNTFNANQLVPRGNDDLVHQ